jgi:hypothetical protein
MDAWMLGYIEGKRAAAEHYERNIKGSFNPHQVAIILRALADIEEGISPQVETPSMLELSVRALSIPQSSIPTLTMKASEVRGSTCRNS